MGGKRVEYHYDLENPLLYASANNRVEYVDTMDTTGGGSVPVSRAWYYYRKNSDEENVGNVAYVVTGPPPAAALAGARVPDAGARVPSRTDKTGAPSSLQRGWGTDDATDARIPSRASFCAANEYEFTATRMEYASNHEAVSYVLGEHWCSNAAGTTTPTKYEVLWAREFRYDGARQRYLNVELDVAPMQGVPAWQPMPIVPVSITRSDYDGDDVYADWSEPIPGSTDPPALLRSFEPGIGRVEPWRDRGGDNTAYNHTDMLGTTRLMTGPDGLPLPGYGTAVMPTPATFTAFGERVQGPGDGAGNRYGYIGEHGYQSHDEFPYLHLGARYYDSAMGRFLQRDPLGLWASPNVYVYAENLPTYWVDPTGQGNDYPTNTKPGGPWLPPPAPGNSHVLKPDGWRPKPPVPPPIPWWKPAFRIGPPQLMACGAAAGAGYVTGRLIDRGVEAATGTSLSDRIGNAIFDFSPTRWITSIGL